MSGRPAGAGVSDIDVLRTRMDELLAALAELRAENAKAWAAVKDEAGVSVQRIEEAAELRAERDTLREALVHIPGCGHCASGRYRYCETYTAALTVPLASVPEQAASE